MRIFRTILVAFGLAVLVTAGISGCAGKQEAGTGGMETSKPMTQEGGTTTPSAGEGETGMKEQKELPPGPKEQPEAVEPARAEKALKDVYFDFDQFSIKPAEATVLEGNASWLKDNPSSVVTIEGHCDERGTVEYNLALGERRASAARDYLVTLGVDASRLKTISYGKSKPADPGHDEAAWAKNRRAHFVVQ